MRIVRGALRCGLGGVGLGLVTLATFSFVGIPTVPTGPPPATLRAALLGTADLPPGFVPLPPPVAGPPTTSCAALIGDPGAGWSGAVEQEVGQAATGRRLWQVVATPEPDALVRLHDRLVACAATDQGVRELPAPVPDGFAFAVSLEGYHGYLAAGRVGEAVSVVRVLTPGGKDAGGELPAATLAAALAKLDAVAKGGPAATLDSVGGSAGASTGGSRHP